MTSEKLKMLAGEWYNPADQELMEDRGFAHSLCRRLSYGPEENLQALLQQLLVRVPQGLTITPPFFCDYGYNIDLADNVYFNANCVLLDICCISIGKGTLLGPSVHIYTVNHPMDAALRRTGKEIGMPVQIGQDVWIGGASVICPGVHIGNQTVIGAGSVVTKSLPSGVFAAGIPCRVVRNLD